MAFLSTFNAILSTNQPRYGGQRMPRAAIWSKTDFTLLTLKLTLVRCWAVGWLLAGLPLVVLSQFQSEPQ
jgi:hypothetical protein